MRHLVWIVFVCSYFDTVTLAFQDIEIKDLGEIVFVNVLFRHGARTPDKTYKNDPYKNFFPEGLGELTKEGKNQSYELGRWLRQLYRSILTDTYSPDLLHVMSSDTDRVLMSAQCCLAGMYPPKGRQIWNKDLNWQPIPVHTVPKDMDKILAMKASCPVYDYELNQVLNSKEVITINKRYQHIINILNENTGEDRKDYKYIANIYDTLKVQSEYNLELPTWTKDIFPKQMEEATVLRFSLPTWTTKLARLRTGPLLQELINNMDNKIAKKTKRVMHLYAAHDSTIINLLRPLNVWDSKLPSYSSCVLIELRRDALGAYNVVMFYRTEGASQHPLLLEIPECGVVCPLDKFIALTKPLIPEDWNSECNMVKPIK